MEDKKEKEKSRIEGLKKRLYSREQRGLGARKRRRLRMYGYEVKEGWSGLPKREKNTATPSEEKAFTAP